jgi:hypothetical protein
MLIKGYKYIVRLTRSVELYLCGGTLSNYMHACKVTAGSEEAKNAIKVARALGYNIARKRGVYYDIDGEKLMYYEEGQTQV